MDNLKRRVQNSGKEFELYDFDPTATWNVISENLDRKSGNTIHWYSSYWRIAAVLVLVLGLFTLVFFIKPFSRSSQLVANELERSEIDDLEMFYSSKIDEKMLLLTGRLTNQPIVKEDLDRLQREYLELKIDLKDNADSEEVIAAMIINYQVRLQLLERMIYDIHDKENENTSNIHL